MRVHGVLAPARRSVALALLATAGATPAVATPDAATWIRHTLVGENDSCFVRQVTVEDHPPSYDEFSVSARLERARKSDLRVVETVPIRDVKYTRDVDAVKWTGTEQELPTFDLAGYLRRHDLLPAFADDLVENRKWAIDEKGVWEVFEDSRERVATRAEYLRQRPVRERDGWSGARVVGLERTRAAEFSNYEQVWLRIADGNSATDAPWTEWLLMVPAKRVH